MNSIDIAFFSCDKYSSLWKDCFYLFFNNFPNQFINKVFLVTDEKPKINLDYDVKVIVCDSKDFINRMQIVLSFITTRHFLFMLDDYFINKKIDTSHFVNIMDLVTNCDADYLKLDIKFKHRLYRPFVHKGVSFSRIKTHKPYGIDLYPSIWKSDFFTKIINSWPFIEKTVWDFEGKLNQISFIKEDRNCFCLRDNSFNYIDVIRKGKLRREANKELIKLNIDLTNEWQLMSKKESMKDKIIPFMASIVPSRLKRFYKKKMTKKGKKFYSLD